MHSFNSIQIVFFSGTGGVKRIADAFGKELANREIMSSQYNLDNSQMVKKENLSGDNIASEDMILLLFPVHAFDAPEPIFEWIRQAALNHKSIAVISVSGGGEVWPNTGCRNNCCKALEKRGANIVYEYMMCMPSNWVFPANDHTAMWLIKVIPDKVNRILDDILTGKIRRPKYKKGFIRSYITTLEKRETKNFAKELMLASSCTGCGLCAKHCPVDNIGLKDHRPVFNDWCIMCFRCIYACPAHAIKSKSFMVLKKGYSLSEVEKHMQGVELEPVEECCKGFMWKAVRNYLLEKDL